MSKPQRRDRGTGSIYQRKDGMWIGYVTLPDDPMTGKRRRRTVSGKLKNDVVKKLRDLRKELDKAGDLPTSSPRVNQWLDQWLDRYVDARLKPRTAQEYRAKVDLYVRPLLGKIRLDRLSPADVHRLHESIMVERGLSSTTALQVHRIVAKALKDAEREGRVGRNVAALVPSPSKAVSTTGALTAEQSTQLLRHHQDDPYKAVRLGVALMGGLRQGEALGLTWEHVDLDAGVITVAWQVQDLTPRHGCPDDKPCGRVRAGNCPQREFNYPPGHEIVPLRGKLHLLRPKSRRGWREVPMTAPLRNALTKWREIAPKHERGLVFGEVVPRNDAKMWAEALREAGLPHIRLHSARDSTATLLHALGVPEQVRMQILGHSSATTTQGYTHISNAEARDAMDRLGELLALGW